MTARGLPSGEVVARERIRLTVRGTVQGVGFRPFVYREATARDLAGWVANSGGGVTLEAEGPPAAVAGLEARLRVAPPANARVEEIVAEHIAPTGDTRFAVVPSLTDAGGAAGLVPDLATCEQCLRELHEPSDRRFRYPFINCTQCGPRYTIVEALPYDRARTSMRRFTMCPA